MSDLAAKHVYMCMRLVCMDLFENCFGSHIYNPMSLTLINALYFHYYLTRGGGGNTPPPSKVRVKFKISLRSELLLGRYLTFCKVVLFRAEDINLVNF